MKSKTRGQRKACFLLAIYLFSLIIISFIPSYSGSSTFIFNDIDSKTTNLFNAFMATWDLARDSDQASDMHDSNYYIGDWAVLPQHALGRAILTFNTSLIPENVTIENVTLSISVSEENGNYNDYYLINGENVGSSIELTDYNRTLWGESYGKTEIDGTGTKKLYVTENLSTSINSTGETKFFIINELDYEDIEDGAKDCMISNLDSASLSITFSYSEDQEETMEDYCYIGDLQQELTIRQSTYVKYIEDRYEIRLTNTIYRVDMVLEHQMYALYPNAENYMLNIEGNVIQGSYIQEYDCNIKAHEGYQQYLIVWDNIDLDVENEYVDVAFGIYSNGSWQPFTYQVMCTNDLNNDGAGCYWYHSDYNMFLNGVYDGHKICPYEIAYRLWIDCPSEDIEDIDFVFENDTVFISPSSDGDLIFDLGETVHYIVYSEDMSDQPYIYINKDESNEKIITMDSKSISSHYTPLTNGSWNITLIRNGVWRDGVNFTVINRSDDNYVYAIPDVVRTYQQYRIYYNFSSDSNYDGLILISENENTEDYIKSFIITENGEGYYYDSRSSEGIYYIHLCVIYPSNSTYILDTEVLHCWNQRENDIEVRSDELNLNVPHDPYQTYRYKHNFAGWDVVVKENGEIIEHVGAEAEGEFNKYVYKTGYKNVTLELLTNSGYIVLAHTEYTIYDSDIGEGDESADLIKLWLDEYFDQWQQWLIGIGIMFIFICLPLFIAWKFDFKNIPNIIYLLSGVVGFSICIKWGLFDIYTIVLFAMIFIGAILWNIFGQMGMLGGSTPRGEGSGLKLRIFDRSTEKAKEK